MDTEEQEKISLSHKERDIRHDSEKPCWNCKHLDNIASCKVHGICPVWLDQEETYNFNCYEAIE